MRKKTNEQFIEQMKRINKNITVLEEYVKDNVRLLCRCEIDGHMWRSSPSNLLRGAGCPVCGVKAAASAKIKTHEKFVEEIKSLHPTIEVLGEYKYAKSKVLCRCRIDGHEWIITPDNLIQGRTCPVCKKKHMIEKTTKSHDDFIGELREINPDVEVLDVYMRSRIGVRCRCLIDGHEWLATPNNLLRGRRCPKCVIEASTKKT